MSVTGLRRLLLNHRALSAWAIALALLMKVAVPAGFMPVIADGRVRIAICSGVEPADAPMAMHGHVHGREHGMMSGMTHPSDPSKPDHGGKDMPCAFAGLTMPSLAAVDAPLLALMIAFIVTTVFRVAAQDVVRVPPFLRPPLRGPPLTA